MTTQAISKINLFLQKASPVLKKLINFENTYLVGGVVRDLLVDKHNIKDIDIVTEKPLEFIKSHSKLIKNTVLLDDKFEVYRVFLQGVDEFYLDVSKIQGKHILEDLSRRDFTIDAVAVSFANSDIKLIDPFNGEGDVKGRLIRKINKTNLLDDPLRMLRAFRLRAELDFEIEKETLDDIKELFSHINRIAKERIKGEIFKILNTERATKTFYELYENNGLVFIFPFIKEYENYFSGKRHQFDLLHHSFKAMEIIENFCNKKSFPVSITESILQRETEGDAKLAGIFKLVAIFHDVGKIFTKNEINGKITYYEHEKVGAEFINSFLQNEKYASETINFITKLVRYHMYPFHILEFGEKKASLSPRIYLKIKKTFDDKVEFLFNFAIADTLATSDDDHTKKMIEFIKKLYNLYLDYEKREKTTCLLNGTEIMETLGLTEGPIVGKLLQVLKEMLLAGELNSKEEAKKFLKSYYEENIR